MIHAKTIVPGLIAVGSVLLGCEMPLDGAPGADPNVSSSTEPLYMSEIDGLDRRVTVMIQFHGGRVTETQWSHEEMRFSVCVEGRNGTGGCVSHRKEYSAGDVITMSPSYAVFTFSAADFPVRWSMRLKSYDGINHSASYTMDYDSISLLRCSYGYGPSRMTDGYGNAAEMEGSWRWIKTELKATIPVRTTNNTFNGPEWHLFAPDSSNCWSWPSSAVYLQPLSSGANPDLYVRKNTYPSLDTYNCRPYLGSGLTESCVIDRTDVVGLYVGVRNRSTTQPAPYRLTITSPIVVI